MLCRIPLLVAVCCILFDVIAGSIIYNRDGSIDGCHGGVQYSNLGCFDLQPPFTNTRWLPQSPDFIGTTFLLYTRDNQGEPDILVADQSDSIANSNFNENNPTKILVHGFLQHRQVTFLASMTRALLEEDAMNVIVVGWSGGAGFPYGQAVANTRLVGAQIAQLVDTLTTQTTTRLTQVHIIGHSLGAHVAGYAGARLSGLGRITALDPAQPNYHGFDPEVRLDSTDAILVDVIHTDATPYDTVRGYGMVEPVGHIDFYPNGGNNQPGCHEEESVFGFVEDAIRNGVAFAETGLSCSHERSTFLFIASISRRRSCHFTGFPCESEAAFLRGECTNCGNIPCPVMGYNSGIYTRARGVFYLNTTSSEPFCGHHHFVTLTMAESMPYAVGSLKVKLVGERGETEWKEIKSGQIDAGEEITKLILSDSLIGHIVSVNVMFIKNNGYFSWSSDQVILHKAKINSQIPNHPKYYCLSDLVLHDRVPLVVTGGSFTEEECF